MMYRQSPNRSHRSKGFKVKHILQICLLLAVCFWLIYQVKRSHEKRREFAAKDEKVVGKVQSDGEIQRFGRKDLPRITEISTEDEKHGEDDAEKEVEEEENKHEEEEPGREDSRSGEGELERGGGDDEIDENEPEKTEVEPELEEEVVDEDKEGEEKEGHAEDEENEDMRKEEHFESDENEDAQKEGQAEPEENEDVERGDHNEKNASLDDADNDGDGTNTREAQEVLYKADDASSEVAHDVQSIIPKTENVTTGRANEIWGKVNFGQENETKTSENADALIKTKEVQPREGANNGTSSDVTVTEGKENEINLTKSNDSSLQNSTLPEISGNLTTVGEGQSAILVEGRSGDKEPNLLANILENTNKSKLAADDNNQLEASTDSNKTENVNISAGEALSTNDTTLASSDKTNDTHAIESKKDTSLGDESQDEKLENSETGVSDVSSNSHSYEEGTEAIHAIQHDPIDVSDTTILTQEERESRTDLDTLPEIRTEVQKTEDTTAE